MFLLLLPSFAFAQRLAVIPYKIANPTDNFTIEDGKEYAKLTAIAAALQKGIPLISHQSVEDAFKKLSLNSQRVITENDLVKIGQLSNAEFLIIGTLSKIKSNYKSDSVLYSMWHKKIISKSHVTSGSFFKLAEEEISEIFLEYPDKKEIFTDRQIDAVIMFDLSYKVAAEWESIKAGIKDFTDSISENWDIDTEISLIPFSDTKIADKYTGLKSAAAVSEKLNKFKPAGGNSGRSFGNALSYSIKNIPWRRKSEKLLIVLSNSEKIEGKFLDQHALTARVKKITINTISLGLMKWDAAEPFRQFSATGSGDHFVVSYHQRFYDENGNPSDLFYQGGRIFHAIAYDDVWKKGLFEDKKKKSSILDKPRSFLNEIYYDEKKYNIIPYTLSKNYSNIMQKSYLNKEQVEDNITAIFTGIGDNFSEKFSRSAYKKNIAKAQISDGKISLWIKIKDDQELDAIRNYESVRNFFPIGIIVKKSPNDPYGITFQQKYIVDFGDDYIPAMLKTSFNSIIKNSDYFTSTGLLNPPVWFVNIKIEKLENLRREYDIREIGK
jgi:hypothetical protein